MQCVNCGHQVAEGTMYCTNCGSPMTPSAPSQTYQSVYQKPENVLTGIVGALVGAALGGASIVLLSQIGYVAAISGFILAVCTLKGYELLAGQRTRRGIIISCILMALTPYIADRIDWAIVIAQTFASEGVTFGMAFAAVHDVVAENEMVGDYFRNLGLIYLFTALGALGTLGKLTKKK